MGESLYAIDGTWFDVDAKTDPYSNVSNFRQNSKEEPKYYYGGPGATAGPVGSLNGGAFGAGGNAIANDVYKQACEDFCKGHCKINLVGWSRGAVIAMEVAERLNTSGCSCQRGPIPVNFVGLYDAVDMMPGRWTHSVPGNVKYFSHAIKTAIQDIFPTVHYGGNERPFDLLEPRLIRERVPESYFRSEREQRNRSQWREVWSYRSTHSDIGTSRTATRAHEWILTEARRAGVE